MPPGIRVSVPFGRVFPFYCLAGGDRVEVGQNARNRQVRRGAEPRSTCRSNLGSVTAFYLFEQAPRHRHRDMLHYPLEAQTEVAPDETIRIIGGPIRRGGRR